MSATMTVREAAAIAGLCKPGEAALVMITVSEGLSYCVGSEEGSHETARNVAADSDPDVLVVAVITADSTVTEYEVPR